MAGLIMALGWLTNRVVQFDSDVAGPAMSIIPRKGEMAERQRYRQRQAELRRQKHKLSH